MRHLLILALILCLFAVPVRAQDENAQVYQVTDVAADVTAANAALARDQAILQAQRAAFNQLLDRLGADKSVAAKLSDDDIASLVQSFEVQNERASAVRYIGTFTVQFRPGAVRSFLDSRSADYSETRGKPVVVVPVYDNGHPVMWEENTRWHAAWSKDDHASGLVPVIVPDGGLDDIAVLSTAEAVGGNANALKALADKYQAGGVAVVTLNGDLDKPGTDFKIDVRHYDADGNPLPEAQLTLPAPSDPAALDATLEQGVKLARHQLEKDWRNQTTALASEPAASAPPDDDSAKLERPIRLPVTVAISTLAEWAQIKHKLDSVPAVVHTDVITLQRGSTSIEIEFRGRLEALQAALTQQNLSLSQDNSNGVWVLRPAAPGSAL